MHQLGGAAIYLYTRARSSAARAGRGRRPGDLAHVHLVMIRTFEQEIIERSPRTRACP